MVSGAVSDNVVVCIFCNNVIYVWRVWWELMGNDLDNIIRYISLSRIYLSYLANFRVGLAMTQEQPVRNGGRSHLKGQMKRLVGFSLSSWTPCSDSRFLDKRSLREYLVPHNGQDNVFNFAL